LFCFAGCRAIAAAGFEPEKRGTRPVHVGRLQNYIVFVLVSKNKKKKKRAAVWQNLQLLFFLTA